jgi:hypothetical protein
MIGRYVSSPYARKLFFDTWCWYVCVWYAGIGPGYRLPASHRRYTEVAQEVMFTVRSWHWSSCTDYVTSSWGSSRFRDVPRSTTWLKRCSDFHSRACVSVQIGQREWMCCIYVPFLFVKEEELVVFRFLFRALWPLFATFFLVYP